MNSSDREVRKAYNNLANEINQQKYSLDNLQTQLQQQFNALQTIITTYEDRKQQNQNKYNESLQFIISSLGDLAMKQLGNTQQKKQIKFENWGILSKKMEIYCMLRQNMKQMFKINSGKNSK